MGSRSIRLTKRAAALAGGALLLFGVGTNVQAGWVLAVAALLLGVLAAGLVIPLRGLDGIEVERDVPRTATAGDKVVVRLDVANRSRRARALFRVADDFGGAGWAVVRLIAPGQTRSFATEREAFRRGVYDAGTATLETAAPFGVLRVRRPAAISSPMVVHPRTYGVSQHSTRGASGWPAPASLGDVSSIRDYRPGDPLRHIHWRSVARRGQLVVREFDRERQGRTAIVAVVPHDRDTADVVASVASSLALDRLRDGEVMLLGGDASGMRPRLARSSHQVLDWGAKLEPRPTLRAVVGAVGGSSGVVCVCPSDIAEVDALVSVATDVPMMAVLIGPPAPVGAQLRAAGASVAEIGPEEVEAWFRSGCAVA